jgi:hypothetical protein
VSIFERTLSRIFETASLKPSAASLDFGFAARLECKTESTKTNDSTATKTPTAKGNFMSNDKKKTDTTPAASTAKAETKTDAATPVATQAVATTHTATPAVKAPKPIVPSLGQKLSQRDPAELDAECATKLEALRALATDPAMPAALQKVVGALVDQAAQVKPGMEEVTTRWRIARVQIAQATSTQAAKPDSAKNGDIYTTAGKLLERPFPFIPFHFSQENIMFPMGAKAPSCQSPDAKLGQPYGECQKCPNLPFGMQNLGKGDQKKTDCQNQIVAVVLAADLSQVYMIQFAKTSRGAGSALISLAGQQQVPWKQTYLLETEKGNSELGNFHKYKVSPTGKDNDEHVQRVAQALCDLYTAERYRMLAEWYRGAASAPAVAAAAEGEFQGGKLDAGLAGETESYDLGDGASISTPSSVRSAAKPM